ncbi:MAG: ArsR family transcriptional regulator [Candidatus Hodarchaeales archaeon]
MENQPERMPITKKNMKRFLMKSIDGIIDILRTIDNSKRLEMLSLMIEGQKMTFSELLEETGLQKSALSNHLSTLVDKNLLEKQDKGLYQISFDGEELLSNIAHYYLNSKIREQQRLVNLLELIGKKPLNFNTEAVEMHERTGKGIVKIVRLPPTRVVSFQAIATGLGTPEPLAKKKHDDWAGPKGLVETLKKTEYKLVKTHQWLEHHVDPTINDINEILFELYSPIEEQVNK